MQHFFILILFLTFCILFGVCLYDTKLYCEDIFLDTCYQVLLYDNDFHRHGVDEYAIRCMIHSYYPSFLRVSLIGWCFIGFFMFHIILLGVLWNLSKLVFIFSIFYIFFCIFFPKKTLKYIVEYTGEKYVQYKKRSWLREWKIFNE